MAAKPKNAAAPVGGKPKPGGAGGTEGAGTRYCKECNKKLVSNRCVKKECPLVGELQ